MTWLRALVIALPPALAATTAGCAGGAAYPSLGTRPAEARGWAELPAGSPRPVPADPALDAQVGAAAAALGRSGAAFAAADARAGPLAAAARGAPAGGERWIAAQAALADLDAAHAATEDAADTLEDLAAARAQALLPDYPPLEAARATATAQRGAEAARIAAIGGGLAPG